MILLNLALLALAGVLVWVLRTNWLEAQAREREAAKGTSRKKVLSAEERTYEGLDKLFAAIDARREPELARVGALHRLLVR